MSGQISGREGRAVMRRLRNVGLGALLAGGFYLLLIDTVSLPEVYVIPAVMLLAGGGFALATRLGRRGYRLPLRWVGAGSRVLTRVPLDVGLVTLELVAQLVRPQARRGGLRTVTVPDPGDEAALTTRAALGEVLGSLAPNTIVIGHDPQRSTLLVHQLRRRGDDASLDPLRGA